MVSSAAKNNEVKTLCREMVDRCDQYLALKKIPESELTAAEVKKDIIRLFKEISRKSRRR